MQTAIVILPKQWLEANLTNSLGSVPLENPDGYSDYIDIYYSLYLSDYAIF